MNNFSKNILASISFGVVSSVASSQEIEANGATITVTTTRGQNCVDIASLSERANCQIANFERKDSEGERLIREKRAEINRVLAGSSFSLKPGGKHGMSEPTYRAGNIEWKLRTSSGGLKFKGEVEF